MVYLVLTINRTWFIEWFIASYTHITHWTAQLIIPNQPVMPTVQIHPCTRRHFSRVLTARLATARAYKWISLKLSERVVEGEGGGGAVQWGTSWTNLNISTEDCTVSPKFEHVPGWDPVQGGGQGLGFWTGGPPPPNRQTDRHDWKHDLHATSFVGGNNQPTRSHVNSRRAGPILLPVKNLELSIPTPPIQTRTAFSTAI